MKKVVSLFLLFVVLQGCHKEPVNHQAPLSCLVPGVWGNDWMVCDRNYDTVPGTLEQRLAQELKLTLRADSTGEMNFYWCPTRERISSSVHFTYQVRNNRLIFNWLGSNTDLAIINVTFNNKNSFKATCKQDTLFVDSLMYNTMYQGASYFVRRN